MIRDGVRKPCRCTLVKFVPYLSDFLRLTATCKEMAELRRDIVRPTILLYYKHCISGSIRRAKESAVETSIEKRIAIEDEHRYLTYLEESERPGAIVKIEANCDKNNKLWQAQFPPVMISAFDEQRFVKCMRCYSGLGVCETVDTHRS
jgi:hypothetical protein